MSKSLAVEDVASIDGCCQPLAELTADQAQVMARRFRALADPIRLRLLASIAGQAAGEVCVCDIDDVGVSQPTVSHHLKQLREAGLVTSERRGTWVYYRVVPDVLELMARFLVPSANDG